MSLSTATTAAGTNTLNMTSGGGIAGLASGFDWQAMVTQLIAVERAPETTLRQNQSQLQQQVNAYSSIQTELGVLQNSIDALKAPSLFDSRQVNVADTTVATATAASGTPAGNYAFQFSQLASAAQQIGGGNVAAHLSATTDVSGVTLASAGFPQPITSGTFTVNGQQITVNTTDTLKTVFDNISTATGGAVTASYDPVADKISLNSSSPIILGSAADTSNFLQAAELNNNGTGAITSTNPLGSIIQTAALVKANFATPITDGGSGAGQFKINGVAINFNSTTDSIADVVSRINDSSAGVTASFDTQNNRFVLTNKTTGDVGISMQDVTGNFLAATNLSSGTLTRGKDLLYTINAGGQLTSHSNTIDGAASGLPGLSVTALKQGAGTSVNVSSDTGTIQTAVTGFVSEYNTVQSMIQNMTATSTDASGKVTTNTLSGQSDAIEIASKLRDMVNQQFAGITSTVKQLAAMGINSNGNDNTLAVTDSSALTKALTNNLSDVKSLFSDSTSGLATQMDSYITTLIGNSAGNALGTTIAGSLVTREGDLTKQSTAIDTQIANMETKITADQARMNAEFVAMETAASSLNTQMSYIKNL